MRLVRRRGLLATDLLSTTGGRNALRLVAISATTAAILAACGSSGNPSQFGPQTDGSAGDDALGDSATSDATKGDSSLIGSDASSCTATSCGSGVCLSGACCASNDVCGSVCCTGTNVCLFGACVTPGGPCYSAGDCAPGQYCETALGSQSDAGAPAPDAGGGGDGGVCTQSPPLAGRCVALPPICSLDAGTPSPDAGCVADC